jgi:hypothetical protein
MYHKKIYLMKARMVVARMVVDLILIYTGGKRLRAGGGLSAGLGLGSGAGSGGALNPKVEGRSKLLRVVMTIALSMKKAGFKPVTWRP